MKPNEIPKINAERLQNWSKTLNKGNFTAIALIGYGHANNDKKLTVITVEGIDDVKLFAFLSDLRDECAKRLNAPKMRIQS